MQSLREIQAHHPTLLLIDAASTVIHVGVTTNDGPVRWRRREGEASSVFFALVAELAAKPDQMDGFIFCEGPGSMLGIRTVAAALRTWVALCPRPIWSYRSLELTARAHGQPGDAFICDARRQSWHQLTVSHGAGNLTPIERVPTTALGTVRMPTGFRTWTPLPAPPPEIVPYEPAQLTSELIDVPLLRDCPEPDAFQLEAPDYARWSPQVHRAPEASA